MKKKRCDAYFKMFFKIFMLFLVSPNVTASELACPASCQIPQNCGLRLTLSDHYIKYYSSYSLARSNPCITTAVIYVHGTSRNAASYFESAIAAAKLENGLENTIIISPSYKTLEDSLGSSELYWSSGGWKQGNKSINAFAEISSFETIDSLVKSLSNNRRFPNLRKIVIAGHSAGGQFTQRYAFSSTTHNSLPSRIEIKYVVMNPSSYVYPNSYRPHPLFSLEFVLPYRIENGQKVMKEEFSLSAGKCPDSYNEYKYGLEKANSYLNRSNIDELAESYPFKKVYYLAGTNDIEDTNEMDSSCPAMTQGLHRYARAESFSEFMNQFFPQNIHQFVPVPGVAHSGSQMIQSAEARDVIWAIKAL